MLSDVSSALQKTAKFKHLYRLLTETLLYHVKLHEELKKMSGMAILSDSLGFHLAVRNVYHLAVSHLF